MIKSLYKADSLPLPSHLTPVSLLPAELERVQSGRRCEEKRAVEVTKEKSIKVTVKVLVPTREHPKVSLSPRTHQRTVVETDKHTNLSTIYINLLTIMQICRQTYKFVDEISKFADKPYKFADKKSDLWQDGGYASPPPPIPCARLYLG